MSVLSAKAALINEIYLTKEFNRLRQARYNLSLNNDLFLKVKEFHLQQAALNEKALRNALSPDEAFELEKELKTLLSFPQVAAYFNACKAMSDLVNSVARDINISIDTQIM